MADNNEYTLVILNERFRRLHLFRIIFLWLNAFMLGWMAFTFHSIYTGIFAALTAGYACYDLFFSKKNIYHSTLEKFFLHGILFAIMGWLSQEFYLLALILAAWAFMGLKLKEHFWLRLNKDGLILQTFYQKKMAWEDLQNIILKDGLLTMDFKSNRIYQAIIIDIMPSTEEVPFNQYCLEHLQSATNTPDLNKNKF
ncbi:MAG: hypothetical protein JSS67_02570 [Bacteroidetes bacterium]|nr:hypothetical protein [Bacteroidota bacterium]